MMSMPKELKSRPKRDDEGEEEGSAKRSIIASVHINSQLETATNMSFFEQTCQAANNINQHMINMSRKLVSNQQTHGYCRPA